MKILRIAALAAILSASQECARGPATSAASAPTQPAFVLSFAAFKGDDMVECDEFSAVTAKPAADIAAAADALWKSFQPGKADGGTVTRLSRPCAEQFSDRPPFGSCVGYAIWKDAPGLRASTFHYAFGDVYRSDWAMKECLNMGGAWSSIPRTSEQFREAQLRFDALNAQKQIDRAMRRLDSLPRGGTL